jgi:16S rRNA (guanine966-N2)-methyltransferase
MRVVAGEAKGRRLKAPAGRATRPTSDRVREAIFDILGSLDVVEGATVADLFAGSGALGIEALSRGARRATFVDNDRAAIAVIRANLSVCGMDGPDRSGVVTGDVLTWAARAPATDLVLADPPYAFADWTDLAAALAPVAGLAVLEAGAALELGPAWRVLKEKHYGGTVVVVARPALPPGGPADVKGGA